MTTEVSCPKGRRWRSFSIIIPSYNRPDQLLVCLQGLARLDYPRNHFEVIVVIDGKGKPRKEPLDYLKEFLSLTILEQPHAGPAVARNTGAEVARGEFLSFLDDDCVPATDWLKRLADRVAASPDCAVGGSTVNVLRRNRYSAASELLIHYLHSYYNADPLHSRFLASNNLAMPAKGFRLVGGFNPRYPLAAAEDRELCRRWLDFGYGLIHEPRAIVYHAHALTFRSFWRQHFGYGCGAYLFHRVCSEERQGCFLPEPKLFYLNLIVYPFRGGRVSQDLQIARLQNPLQPPFIKGGSLKSPDLQVGSHKTSEMEEGIRKFSDSQGESSPSPFCKGGFRGISSQTLGQRMSFVWLLLVSQAANTLGFFSAWVRGRND